MTNQLAALRAAGGQAHAEHHVVQTLFERGEHQFAGDAFLLDGLLIQITELAFEHLIITAGFLLFAQAANRSPRLWLSYLCRAGQERSCAFRWHTFQCGSARPSETISCPRAGIAGKRDHYNVPINDLHKIMRAVATLLGAVYGEAFVPLKLLT